MADDTIAPTTRADIHAAADVILDHLRSGRVAREEGRVAACIAIASILDARIPGAREPAARCRAATTASEQRSAMAAAWRWAVQAGRPPRATTRPADADDRMTVAEVAAWCGVSIGTIARWRREGLLRPISPGPKLRFLRSEVEQVAQRRDNAKLQPRRVAIVDF